MLTALKGAQFYFISWNESQPTEFAWLLVFLSRNHVVSDEYFPSPLFVFVEFWEILEFIVYDVNN